MRTELYNGVSWRRLRKEIRINPNREPNPHMIIVGMSGYGKSTLFKSILADIKGMGISAIVFDAHNEHEKIVRSLNGRVYDCANTGINILELNGLSKEDRISELVSLLKNVYSLGYIQATKLGACLRYTYRKLEMKGVQKRQPTMSDLLKELNIFIKNSRSAAETNTLQHLKEKISLLNNSAFNSNTVSVEGLKEGISSFSLAGLKSTEARVIYIHELLKRIYTSMKGMEREKGLRLFIMIDEAQFLLNSQAGYNSVRSMVEEGRKYGSGVVIATHITGNLDRQVLANASTLISFYSRDPSEVNYIASAMSGGEEQRRSLVRSKLRELKQNEALVVTGRMKEPIVVTTPTAKQVVEAAGPEAPAQKTNTDNEKKRSFQSAEHYDCVNRVSDRLSELRIRHFILNNSQGPDIVAYIRGVKTAIEYETGRKSYRSTSKMLDARSKEYPQTIVFVNSRAFGFYKSYFEKDKTMVLNIEDLKSFSGHISPAANCASPLPDPSRYAPPAEPPSENLEDLPLNSLSEPSKNLAPKAVLDPDSEELLEPIDTDASVLASD